MTGFFWQDTLDAAQADAESVVVDRLSILVEEGVNCCVGFPSFFSSTHTLENKHGI